MIKSLDDLYLYALTLFGIWYEYGGEGPGSHGPLGQEYYGFDCSGLACHLLRRSGVLLPGDFSADGLYRRFQSSEPGIKRGSLVFFGTPAKAVHVGWALNEELIISAAAGDTSTTTRKIAISRAASVKIQPIAWYKAPPFLGAFTPEYDFS